MEAQLHPCNSLSVRLELLEDTIYSEESEIFGHCTFSPKRNLAGKSPRILLAINLIKQTKLLLTQISSTVDPHEQATLRELLAPIKDKTEISTVQKNIGRKGGFLKNHKKDLIRTHIRQGKNCLTLSLMPNSQVQISICGR